MLFCYGIWGAYSNCGVWCHASLYDGAATGNEPETPSSFVVGIGGTRRTDLGSSLIVTSCGTLRTPVEGTSDASHVVTPVTHIALDPLMHTSTLNQPNCISLSVIETPPVESYTHVSVHDSCIYFYQFCIVD
jgi:hypothetical protein